MFVDEFDDRFDCNHKGAWIDVDDQHPGMFYIATNYDDEEHFIATFVVKTLDFSQGMKQRLNFNCK